MDWPERAKHGLNGPSTPLSDLFQISFRHANFTSNQSDCNSDWISSACSAPGLTRRLNKLPPYSFPSSWPVTKNCQRTVTMRVCACMRVCLTCACANYQALPSLSARSRQLFTSRQFVEMSFSYSELFAIRREKVFGAYPFPSSWPVTKHFGRALGVLHLRSYCPISLGVRFLIRTITQS